MVKNTKPAAHEKLIMLIEQSLFLNVKRQEQLITIIREHPDGDFSKLLRLLERGEEMQKKMYERIAQKNPNFLQDLKQAQYRALSNANAVHEESETEKIDKDLDEQLKNIPSSHG